MLARALFAGIASWSGVGLAQSLEETVTLAVRGGLDVLLFSNTANPRLSLGDEIRAILIAEAQKDPAFRARMEESYKRIVALKTRIGGMGLAS